MTLPSRNEAWQTVCEWMQSDSLRKHVLAVEAAVRRDVPAAAARFLGEARLGVARPDVARAVAPQFHAAGFELTVSGLEPGRYDLMVFAWNRRTARWEDARVVPLEVGRAPDRQ